MWLVRAGKNGEREKLALKRSVVVIGYEDLPDLAAYKTRTAMAELLMKVYSDAKSKTLTNWESQVWPMINTIAVADLVVLPLKTRADVAIGRIKGDYQYRRDIAEKPLHTRPVEWLREFPRSAFDKDLLFSFGAFMTVCRIERNNAEQRVVAMLGGKAAAGASNKIGGSSSELSNAAVALGDTTDATALPDVEQQSQDLIRERIAQRFKGHGLATLVAAVLEAQGYRTTVAPPGPDGGVDIMAGCGPLGFDAPRLIAQVKSQASKVDVKVVRELTGIMGKFHADHALLVSWGGFTSSALAETASDYFRLRLWDAGNVVRSVQDHYEQLPDAIRAEMPLKRVWTLVPDDGES